MDSPEDRETGGKSPGKKQGGNPRPLEVSLDEVIRPRMAFKMSDPSEFVDAVGAAALAYSRDSAALRNDIGAERIDAYDWEEVKKYLFDMRAPKTTQDRWGNLKVTWNFGRGKKIKGLVRWDKGVTWFEDEYGRVQEPMPQNVARMLMTSLLKPKAGGGTVRRRRRPAA